jgi:hypothetical protein
VTTAIVSTRGFAALREFARPRPALEHCDMCAAPLDATHEHLFDAGTGQLRCACAACTLLLVTPGARWALVRHRAQRLLDFRLTDEEWQALALPIDLAFFVVDGDGRVTARYPSVAGTIESALALPAWDALVAANPVLAGLQPNVEALLVRRAAEHRDHLIVSLDECYRLVGLIRLHWRGFGGGPEVWAAIDGFFGALDERRGAP